MSSALQPSLTVSPGPALSGTFVPPGDKSITHRAFLFGALAAGETIVEHPNPGIDCASTLDCLEALGVPARRTATAISIEGTGGRFVEPERVLDCGNSGTTLRLLCGALAAQPFLTILSGDRSLNRRPVARIVEPLRLMGARLSARGGDRFPPLALTGGPLEAIRYRLPVPSAQVASSILLAALCAPGETVIEVPGPARDHSERMMPSFGLAPDVAHDPATGGRRVALRGPARLTGAHVTVPGDFSAAAFFLASAAATPGSRVTARGVSLNPTRTGLLDVLEAMGATVRVDPSGTVDAEPRGDVTVVGPDALRAFDVPASWVPRLIDEVPAWAIAAAAAEGVSRLTGAAELRVKETDRIAAIVENCARLGIDSRSLPDGLAIRGGVPGGGTVRSFGDHRIAMAFAALGTRARAPVTVEEVAPIATSYPGFAVALAALGGTIRTADSLVLR